MEKPQTAALQNALVDDLSRKGVIHSPPVAAAFRAIPRHLFVPGISLDAVYRDEVIVTKQLNGTPVSSCSQPAMVAVMLEQLALEPGHRVLEIGAGTGYMAALVAHLVGDTGQVVTVDIDQDLVDGARDHLSAAGMSRVQVECADGWHGYAQAAPYDRIILTVGASDISPAWRQQLMPGGRLLMPLEIKPGVQKSALFEQMEGHLASVSLRDCGFMMMRGESKAAVQPGGGELGPEPGLSIGFWRERSFDLERIYAWLTGPSQNWPTQVKATLGELWTGLNLWVTVHDGADDCNLTARGKIAEQGIVPCLIGDTVPEKWCSTGGILADNGLALLTRIPDQFLSLEQLKTRLSFDLFVRSYGPDAGAAQRLIGYVQAWDAARRPRSERLRIRAYPAEARYKPLPGEFVVVKPWTQLVISWQ